MPQYLIYVDLIAILILRINMIRATGYGSRCVPEATEFVCAGAAGAGGRAVEQDNQPAGGSQRGLCLPHVQPSTAGAIQCFD